MLCQINYYHTILWSENGQLFNVIFDKILLENVDIKILKV